MQNILCVYIKDALTYLYMLKYVKLQSFNVICMLLQPFNETDHLAVKSSCH